MRRVLANHFCNGKAINITCSECMFVALGIRHAMRMRQTDICGLSGSTLFFHISHTCKECHKTESLWKHNTTDHKEGEQLEDRRSVGAYNCNCGDGTDQRVQSLMFMMMMMTLHWLCYWRTFCLLRLNYDMPPYLFSTCLKYYLFFIYVGLMT